MKLPEHRVDKILLSVDVDEGGCRCHISSARRDHLRERKKRTSEGLKDQGSVADVVLEVEAMRQA